MVGGTRITILLDHPVGAGSGRRLRLPARAGGQVVARRHVVEIGKPHAGLVDELHDARQLDEQDLRHLVRVRVVVGMESGRVEDHRHAFGCVAVLIAPVVELLGLRLFVQLLVENHGTRQRLIRPLAAAVQPAAAALLAARIDSMR